MNAAASASCRRHMHEQARTPSRRRAPPIWASITANPRRTRPRPLPVASHSQRRKPGQRIGRSSDDAEIDHERPGIGRRADDTSSGTTSEPARPEARQRRPVQRGGQHGGDADEAEQDEGRGRADEAVERVRGIGGAEGAGRAGGGEDARHMRGGDRLHRQPALGAAEPFAGGNEGEREERAERNAHAGSEYALLDRIAHQQQAAERQRQAADPDRPARAEPLFQCGPAGAEAATVGTDGGSDGSGELPAGVSSPRGPRAEREAQPRGRVRGSGAARRVAGRRSRCSSYLQPAHPGGMACELQTRAPLPPCAR